MTGRFFGRRNSSLNLLELLNVRSIFLRRSRNGVWLLLRSGPIIFMRNGTEPVKVKLEWIETAIVADGEGLLAGAGKKVDF